MKKYTFLITSELLQPEHDQAEHDLAKPPEHRGACGVVQGQGTNAECFRAKPSKRGWSEGSNAKRYNAGHAARSNVKTTQSKKTSALRLDQALAKIAPFSRSFIRKLIFVGAVYLNGKRIRIASKIVHTKDKIDLYVDPKKKPPSIAPNHFLPLRVLYEDEAIICFDKPAGLPTQPTLDNARANLYSLAKEQKKAGGFAAGAYTAATCAESARDNVQCAGDEKKCKSDTIPGGFAECYLGLHHRLDSQTSGVILFTQDKKYNAFIADQFKNHLCTKQYVAVVHGKLPRTQGRLESFLGPIDKKGKKMRFGSISSGGKKAITDFLVLAQNLDYSLVEVKITTGRTHQIRVHFAEMGHPIVGDTLYGSNQRICVQQIRHNTQRIRVQQIRQNTMKLSRHLLHAHTLTIEHPISHKLVHIESSVPEEFRQWVLSKP